MAQKYTTHVIRGTLNWAKVIGKPAFNEYAKENQWSVDVTPNAEGMKELKRLGLATGSKSKIKNKKDDRGDFISFRQGEFKKAKPGQEPEPNEPIEIRDAQGNLWPAGVLIGNGTIADVKFSYTDFGETKGSYIRAIRVLQLVPYVKQEFAPLSEDDEFFAGGPVAEEAAPVDTPLNSSMDERDLDDDIPF